MKWLFVGLGIAVLIYQPVTETVTSVLAGFGINIAKNILGSALVVFGAWTE